MTTTLSHPAFDYAANAISPDDEAVLEACAARVEESREAAVNNFMAVAGSIAVAHGVFANRGNGCFGEWCDKRCGLKRTQSHRLLSVYRRFGECSIDGTNFDCGSLLLLADDDVGDDLRQKIIDAGNSGTPISQALVKGILSIQESADDIHAADAATDELLSLATSGERISKKAVREVAKSHGLIDDEQVEREERLSHFEAVSQVRSSIDKCIRDCSPEGRAELALMFREYLSRLEKGVSNGDG